MNTEIGGLQVCRKQAPKNSYLYSSALLKIPVRILSHKARDSPTNLIYEGSSANYEAQKKNKKEK